MIRIEVLRASKLVRDVIDSVNFVDLLAMLVIGIADVVRLALWVS